MAFLRGAPYFKYQDFFMVNNEADNTELAQAILRILEKRGITSIDMALQAIKKEAAILF